MRKKQKTTAQKVAVIQDQIEEIVKMINSLLEGLGMHKQAIDGLASLPTIKKELEEAMKKHEQEQKKEEAKKIKIATNEEIKAVNKKKAK